MSIQPQAARMIRPGRITAGLIVLGLGLAMLLESSGLADVHLRQLVAPFVLIAIGSALVLDQGACGAGCSDDDVPGAAQMRLRRRNGSTGGLWLIGVGAWMLVSQTHMFGLAFHTSWPLLVIFAGVIVTMRGMR